MINDASFVLVYPNSSANLWHCPDTYNMWCGRSAETPCKTAYIPPGMSSARSYPSGINIGSPPTILTSTSQTLGSSSTLSSGYFTVTSSEQRASSSGSSTSRLFTIASSTAASRPTAPSRQGNQTAVAIGAGIGVPLGIAVIGLLGFLFSWSQRKRKDEVRNYSRHHQSFQAIQTPRYGGEMPDTQIPTELDPGAMRVEMQSPTT